MDEKDKLRMDRLLFGNSFEDEDEDGRRVNPTHISLKPLAKEYLHVSMGARVPPDPECILCDAGHKARAVKHRPGYPSVGVTNYMAQADAAAKAQHDVHLETAKRIFGTEYPTPAQRREARARNFEGFYGGARRVQTGRIGNWREPALQRIPIRSSGKSTDLRGMFKDLVSIDGHQPFFVTGELDYFRLESRMHRRFCTGGDCEFCKKELELFMAWFHKNCPSPTLQAAQLVDIPRPVRKRSPYPGPSMDYIYLDEMGLCGTLTITMTNIIFDEEVLTAALENKSPKKPAGAYSWPGKPQ